MTHDDSDAGGPRLSVVVTIVDGRAALHACLDALQAQAAPPTLEVIVPYDASVAWAEALARDFPSYRFLPLGHVRTEKPLESPAGQHELFDRRRAAGLSAATGQLIGILEDRGVPDPDWARAMDRLHAALPHAVIGGAVECGVDRTLNWATYFCDFGRYQLPLEPGPRVYVTDVNIAYKREALEKTRHLWKERYHETTVNWALARAGETLFLSPEPVVRQVRRDLRLASVLHERLDWGRLFAYTRVRECGLARRLAYAVLSPVLPGLLLARHTGMQARKRTRFRRFLAISPVVALLLAAWSHGEMRGYLTGKP